MNGPIPTRVDRTVKERLLALVDDALDRGWTLTRACSVLELDRSRVWRWQACRGRQARRHTGSLTDRAPGGNPMITALASCCVIPSSQTDARCNGRIVRRGYQADDNAQSGAVATESADRPSWPAPRSLLQLTIRTTTLCSNRNGQAMGRACHGRCYRRCVREREDGAALVEFAIILPLLLIIVFGIISFGLIFNHKLSLTSGAREAGRFGATLPVTNFVTMQEWLDEIAARAVSDAIGSLEPDAPNRMICVAYVHPNGSAPVDKTSRRLEVGGIITYSNDSCFPDDRPKDERRVQVRVGRDTDLEAIFFSMTIPLSAESATRFEASLVAS